MDRKDFEVMPTYLRALMAAVLVSALIEVWRLDSLAQRFVDNKHPDDHAVASALERLAERYAPKTNMTTGLSITPGLRLGIYGPPKDSRNNKYNWKLP